MKWSAIVLAFMEGQLEAHWTFFGPSWAASLWCPRGQALVPVRIAVRYTDVVPVSRTFSSR
jgi:hypothetical protein